MQHKLYYSHKSKLKYKNTQFILGYRQLGKDPIANIFNEDGIYIIGVKTLFNNQELVIKRKSPKLNNIEYKYSIKYLMDTMLEKIENYKSMLAIDKEYKLHKDHSLINGRLY